MNKVVLVGRLVRDPELRYTPQGTALTMMTVAIDRPYADSNGERKTDFIRVAAWRKLAETCAQHLKKGRLIAVDGRLEVHQFTGQDDARKTIYEVVADDVRFGPAATRGEAADAPDGDREPFPGSPGGPQSEEPEADVYGEDTAPPDDPWATGRNPAELAE